MKTILIHSATLMFCLSANAQEIPNSGFENWTETLITLELDDWVTGNAGISLPVNRDEDAYEGDYAMRVVAIPDGIGFSAQASTTVPLTAIPAALNFHVRSFQQFGGSGVNIAFFNGETQFYYEYWSTDANYTDWTAISIPLDQLEPLMTHCVITVDAGVGDLVAGTAWIAIDAMSFGEVLSTETDTREPVFSIWPNPAVDNLTLSAETGTAERFEIFDLSGRMVMSGSLFGNSNRFNISALAPAPYLMKILDESGHAATQRFIKE